MLLLRTFAALCTVAFATAIPRVAESGGGLRRLKAHSVADEATETGHASHSFSPDAMPTAPDGMPECEIYDGPFANQENQLDSWVGPGTCARLIASGKSCEHDFCPFCNRNADCDKLCGFCESTADEPVDCREENHEDPNDPCYRDPTCQDDEAARAAADPFKDERSPFTQGCWEIAEAGFCEEQAYIDLGVQNYCCESCALKAEKDEMNGVCDFMAVVNGCQDPDAIREMNSGRIERVCNNACSLSVMDNWEICTADRTSDFAKFQDQLEPIVTGCRKWNNGGHYDPSLLYPVHGNGR